MNNMNNVNGSQTEFFVNFCSNKVEEIKCGNCKGKIWNSLKNNPIGIAFKGLKDMENFKHNEFFEKSKSFYEDYKVTPEAFKKLELVENELVEFLIANQNDPEVDEVIQKIYESNTFGIAMERKIDKCPKNSEHKWEQNFHPKPYDETIG